MQLNSTLKEPSDTYLCKYKKKSFRIKFKNVIKNFKNRYLKDIK